MGFVKKRASMILQSCFGDGYSAAKIALLTQLPDDDGNNYKEVDTTVEVDGETVATGYSRILLGAITAVDDSGNYTGIITNTTALHFPEAEQAWGTVVGFAIFSNFQGMKTAASGSGSSATAATYYSDAGTMCFYGELDAPVTIPKEYIPLFRKNAIKIGLDQDPSA